jgi:hypothetical protein
MLPLASAIDELRAELLEAVKKGAGKDLQFKLEPIELELKVVVTKKGEGNAGVKFWVVELGAKGAYENAMTHTLKLKLEPVGKGQSEFLISDVGVERPAGG